MAIIKEKGTIAYLSEVQSGVSQSGNAWARQTIVVDVEGYNGTFRKLALQASGNIVEELKGVTAGTKVEVSYQVTAREWNGKWYNNVDLFKINFDETPSVQPASQPQIPANTPMDLQEDDLPPSFYPQQ